MLKFWVQTQIGMINSSNFVHVKEGKTLISWNWVLLKLKLELILRNKENLHTMFIMYSFSNLQIIGFWKNGWWSIYNWFDVCCFEVFRCCVLIMNNLNVFKINTLFSWFFFLCESILWLIYNLIVFSVHLLLIRRFFSCGQFFF